MFFTLASLLLPPLLVFGVYHLLTWFDLFHINNRAYWKRVALASASSHLLLVTGFLVFSYFDFQAHARMEAGLAFDQYLFGRSDFWRLIFIFDIVPMAVILVLFSAFESAGVNPPGLVFVTFALAYVVGTIQWFFVGGGIGALLERFWSGLKTGDEEDEEWM